VVLTLSLAVALAVALFFLFFGPKSQRPSPQLEAELAAAKKAAQKAEGEAERRRKELDEQRTGLNELKEQLKVSKRKLFEQREASSGPAGQNRARAQEEALREIQGQLGQALAERAAVEAELQKLRAETEIGRRRVPVPPPPAPVAPPAAQQIAAPAVTAPPSAPRTRELGAADKEKMERLEQNATHERRRALELERELIKQKRKSDSQNRLYAVTKGEAGLLKDKYKALEKRLNRILLEDDLLRRALRTLEEKTGHEAERIELTAEEADASDRSVDEQLAKEEADEAAHTQGEPLPATEPDVAEPPRAHS